MTHRAASSPAHPRKPRGPGRRDFGDDSLAYYHAHYDGLTRGQLKWQDQSLYRVLWRRKLLDRIPTKR